MTETKDLIMIYNFSCEYISMWCIFSKIQSRNCI